MVRKTFLIKIAVLSITFLAVAFVVAGAMRSRIFMNSSAMTERTFFNHFVIAGGAIVWFILLPMSIITASLAVEHCITIRRKKLLPPGITTEILTLSRQFGAGQLAIRLRGRKDFLSTAIITALESAKAARGTIEIRNLLVESLQEQTFRLFRKIECVNIIGNVAPMVGLFGTVVGMINAFNVIVAAGGQPQPSQLAGGISVALVTTFWGLLIAIPAIAIHGILRNRIEIIAGEAALEAEIVLAEINPGPKTAVEQKMQMPFTQQNVETDKTISRQVRS